MTLCDVFMFVCSPLCSTPMMETENFTIFIKNSIRFPTFNYTKYHTPLYVDIKARLEHLFVCLTRTNYSVFTLLLTLMKKCYIQTTELWRERFIPDNCHSECTGTNTGVDICKAFNAKHCQLCIQAKDAKWIWISVDITAQYCQFKGKIKDCE